MLWFACVGGVVVLAFSFFALVRRVLERPTRIRNYSPVCLLLLSFGEGLGVSFVGLALRFCKRRGSHERAAK